MEPQTEQGGENRSIGQSVEDTARRLGVEQHTLMVTQAKWFAEDNHDLLNQVAQTLRKGDVLNQAGIRAALWKVEAAAKEKHGIAIDHPQESDHLDINRLKMGVGEYAQKAILKNWALDELPKGESRIPGKDGNPRNFSAVQLIAGTLLDLSQRH